MKYSSKRCLPILLIALSLSACGKSKTADHKASGGDELSAVTTAQIEAAFEADCGGEAPAAAATSSYDVTSCQLNNNQMVLLKEVGPFKVHADCAHRSVRVVNGSDQITGQGSLKDDGTFSVPLNVGGRFSELNGCPVSLKGLASGTVTCHEDQRVEKVEMSTTFTFADGSPESAALDAAGLRPLPASSVVVANLADSGMGSPSAEASQAKGGQSKGGQEKGGQEKVAAATVATTSTQEQSKGTIVTKEGKQVDTGTTAPGQNVNACVKFSPCGFSTKTVLSCNR